MGALFDNEGDKQQAYQYHFDSYRYFPSNLGNNLYYYKFDIVVKGNLRLMMPYYFI